MKCSAHILRNESLRSWMLLKKGRKKCFFLLKNFNTFSYKMLQKWNDIIFTIQISKTYLLEHYRIDIIACRQWQLVGYFSNVPWHKSVGNRGETNKHGTDTILRLYVQKVFVRTKLFLFCHVIIDYFLESHIVFEIVIDQLRED